MPTYEYKCKACEHTLEEYQSFNDKPLEKCPKCKKKALMKLLSGGLGFSVKGGTSSTNLGGRYVPMDSAEQKLEQRMTDLAGGGEV